jgi:hypothetical protein
MHGIEAQRNARQISESEYPALRSAVAAPLRMLCSE